MFPFLRTTPPAPQQAHRSPHQGLLGQGCSSPTTDTRKRFLCSKLSDLTVTPRHPNGRPARVPALRGTRHRLWSTAARHWRLAGTVSGVTRRGGLPSSRARAPSRAAAATAAVEKPAGSAASRRPQAAAGRASLLLLPLVKQGGPSPNTGARSDPHAPTPPTLTTKPTPGFSPSSRLTATLPSAPRLSPHRAVLRQPEKPPRLGRAPCAVPQPVHRDPCGSRQSSRDSNPAAQSPARSSGTSPAQPVPTGQGPRRRAAAAPPPRAAHPHRARAPPCL